MSAIACQITSLTIVYSTVYSDADQRIHQSSASLAFVLGIHRGPVNSPHKWPVTRKMFTFDDVIIELPTTKESSLMAMGLQRTSKETASLWSRHARRHVRHARAVMHVGIANPRLRWKRYRLSRHIRNPQFYVTGKRPMCLHKAAISIQPVLLICFTFTGCTDLYPMCIRISLFVCFITKFMFHY